MTPPLSTPPSLSGDPLRGETQPVGRYIPTAIADFDFTSPMFCLGKDIYPINRAMDWRNDQVTLLDAIDETYEACHDHTRALAGSIELGCSCVETLSIEWHRAQLRQGLMQLLTRVTAPAVRRNPRTKFQYAIGALKYVMALALLLGAAGSVLTPPRRTSGWTRGSSLWHNGSYNVRPVNRGA